MPNEKPIRMLLLVSLVAYTAYAVLYTAILLTQPYSTQMYGGIDFREPYYDWIGLVIVVVSAAARALLYGMVQQHLRAPAWRPFVVIGVYYLVLTLLLPVFVSPIYSIVSTRIVAMSGTNSLAAYSILRAAQSLVSPLAAISNYAAFAGCSIAWYRNSCLMPPQNSWSNGEGL